MHLVDLQVGADKGIHLELHPRLTVVQAGAAAQERLVSLLGRAYVLAGTEVTGTVDGGGYLTPFDPTAVVALDLVGDGLDVVGPSDLPSPDPAPREAARAAAAAALERRREELRTRSAELEGIVRMQNATDAAVRAGVDERSDVTTRLDELDATARALHARGPELDEARTAAALASDVTGTRLDELRSMRVQLGRALGPCEDATELRNGDDTTELADLVRRAASLGALRGDEVDPILGWLSDLHAGQAPIRADAKQLAAAVEDVESAWQRAAALGVEGDAVVGALAAERADIGENHDLLVELSESGLLGSTAKSQIDAAHVAVVCSGRSDSDAAIAAEVEVLARYGFDSYLDYTIATSTRSVGQAVEAKLDELSERVVHLDTALVEARAAAADRLERLAGQREPAQQRVTELLGYRPDGSSLEHLARLPEVPPAVSRLTVTVDEAVEQAQLDLVRCRDAVTELDEERSEVDARCSELDARRSTLVERTAEIDSLIATANDKAELLGDRLQRSAAAVATSESALAAGEAELQRLDRSDAVAYAASDISAVVEALLARVEPRNGPHRPVVLVDTFGRFADVDGLAALEALTERSENCQWIYVTDDRLICNWARSLDPVRGRFDSASMRRWSPRRLGRRMLSRRDRSERVSR